MTHEPNPRDAVDLEHDEGREAEAVLQAVREAVHEAVIKHKKMGWPMVDYRDGQVVWVPPEELPDEPPWLQSPEP